MLPVAIDQLNPLHFIAGLTQMYLSLFAMGALLCPLCSSSSASNRLQSLGTQGPWGCGIWDGHHGELCPFPIRGKREIEAGVAH